MAPPIVITGASGLLGRHLVPLLTARGPVVAVGRTRPPEPAGWIQADLADPIDRSLLPASATTFIHLAQSEFFRDFPSRAGHMFAINVIALTTFLEWAVTAGVRTVVLASSGGIYGQGRGPFSEDDPSQANGELGFYLASKRAAEILASGYGGLMKVVILRPFFVYGAGQRSSMLIPRLIDGVRCGRPIDLKGEDGIRINPIHVRDAASAFAATLDLVAGTVINVAGPETLSMRQIGELIGKKIGRPPQFRQVLGDSGDLIGDTSKMSRLLVSPGIRLAQGLTDLVGS